MNIERPHRTFLTILKSVVGLVIHKLEFQSKHLKTIERLLSKNCVFIIIDIAMSR